MKKVFFALAVLAVAGCARQHNPSLEEKVESTLSQMTLQEKVAMTHAQSKFSSAGVPRLGIPELWHTDARRFSGTTGTRPDGPTTPVPPSRPSSTLPPPGTGK